MPPALPKKKLLNNLAARATLHSIFAATPASLPSPSTCLAARPLVLYLGAGCSGFPVADGVYRFSTAWFSPSSCAIGLPADVCLFLVLGVRQLWSL